MMSPKHRMKSEALRERSMTSHLIRMTSVTPSGLRLGCLLPFLACTASALQPAQNLRLLNREAIRPKPAFIHSSLASFSNTANRFEIGGGFLSRPSAMRGTGASTRLLRHTRRRCRLQQRTAPAMMAGGIMNLLEQDVVSFLATSVLVVPVCKQLNISPVLGFLGAGLALGPYGLGLLKDLSDLNVLGEIGILFLLFEQGLELSVERLKSLAKYAFGLGTLQVRPSERESRCFPALPAARSPCFPTLPEHRIASGHALPAPPFPPLPPSSAAGAGSAHDAGVHGGAVRGRAVLPGERAAREPGAHRDAPRRRGLRHRRRPQPLLLRLRPQDPPGEAPARRAVRQGQPGRPAHAGERRPRPRTRSLSLPLPPPPFSLSLSLPFSFSLFLSLFLSPLSCRQAPPARPPASPNNCWFG